MKITVVFSIILFLFLSSFCFSQPIAKKVILKIGKHEGFYRIVFQYDEDQLKIEPEKNNKIKIYIPENIELEFQNKIIKEGEIIKNFSIKKYNDYFILNTPQFNDYKIYKIPSPFRVVVDIFSPDNADKASLAVLIIDAGHGGKDAGIVHENLAEKDVALILVKELQKKFSQKGIKNILTRDSDMEISIKDRLQFLNKNEKSVFFSIHFSKDDSFKFYSKNKELNEKFFSILKSKISQNYSEPFLIENIPVYGIKDPDKKIFILEISKKLMTKEKNKLNKLVENIVESFQEYMKNDKNSKE